MFPSASKQYNLIQNNAFLSPTQQSKNKLAGHLPYFKRFPHNKYKSQQRKRTKNSIYFNNINQNTHNLSPPKLQNQLKFFKQENQQATPQYRYNFSSSIINRRQSKTKPRVLRNHLFKNLQGNSNQINPNNAQQKLKEKQFYSKDREKTKLKHKTQQSHHNKNNNYQERFSVNQLLVQKPGKALTAKKILQMQKGILTQLQLLEIGQYDQIFFYGQNCIKKKQSLKQMTKQDGGYVWIKGDHIAYRYQILDQLGQGSFGQVFKCFDHKRKLQVAVKVVKQNQKYTKQAKIQIKLLNYIKVKDPLSSKNCIQIRDYFNFRNRTCMTFDLLSINLYQLTKNNGYYGFPLDLIRRFALQILNAIYFLHKNHIIHADLKPQNILLKQAHKSGVKVIDFGSSCFQNQTIYTYIQSRYYRAPEVILGLPYNRKIDIWSFGCIMAELHLGYPLFAGQDQHQQMCYLIEVLGKPSSSMIDSAKRWKVFFNPQNQLKPHDKKVPPSSKSLNQALQNPSDQQFVEFIRKCLQWVPQKRLQALELLKAKWILKGLPEQILQQHMDFIKQQQRQNHSHSNQHQGNQGSHHNAQTQIKKNRKSSFIIKQRNRLM